MTQWYLLGIYLGIHPSILDPINADYKTTTECRTQMLIEWQKCVIPTWSAVVKALVGIGRERLASHLATKYGMLDLTLYPGSSCDMEEEELSLGIWTCVYILTLHKIPVVTHNCLLLQEFPFQTQLTINL